MKSETNRLLCVNPPPGFPLVCRSHFSIQPSSKSFFGKFRTYSCCLGCHSYWLKSWSLGPAAWFCNLYLRYRALCRVLLMPLSKRYRTDNSTKRFLNLAVEETGEPPCPSWHYQASGKSENWSHKKRDVFSLSLFWDFIVCIKFVSRVNLAPQYNPSHVRHLYMFFFQNLV